MELFTKALYVRQIGRLTVPSQNRVADVVMAYVNRAYGHLRMGRRLLTSSCDFLHLPEATPSYWKLALQSKGMVRGLVPCGDDPNGQKKYTPEVTYREAKHEGKRRTVNVDGQEWSLGQIMMEPLFYNPCLSGWWGAHVLDEAIWERDQREKQPKVKLIRHSKEREKDAREVYERSKKFARAGLTHVCHLIGANGRLMTWQVLKGLIGRRGTMPCGRDEYEALLASIPTRWKKSIDDGSMQPRRPTGHGGGGAAPNTSNTTHEARSKPIRLVEGRHPVITSDGERKLKKTKDLKLDDVTDDEAGGVEAEEDEVPQEEDEEHEEEGGAPEGGGAAATRAADMIQRRPLPDDAWVATMVNGEWIIAQKKTGKGEGVHVWLADGSIQTEAKTADVRTIESIARATGWDEVAVWMDGGQSSASVRREEWGEESEKGHQELGKKKELKRLVCGGKIVSRRLLQRTATTGDGWRAACDPSRWAVQFGVTTRERAPIRVPNLAVKHLYNLMLSRLYRPMRTLDPKREPENREEHTTWIDLLEETEREEEQRMDGPEELEIDKIVARRPKGKGFEYRVRWQGHDDPKSDTWEPWRKIEESEAAKEFMSTIETGESSGAAEWIDGGETTAYQRDERRMMYSMFDSIQDRTIPSLTADIAYSVLTDAMAVGKGRCAKKSKTTGICDWCWHVRKMRVVETTRHATSECPASAIVQEAAIRAATAVSTVEADTHERTARQTWQEIIEEQRRLTITGYRHCASDSIMADERRGLTPWRVWMLEILRGIIHRRQVNAYDDQPLIIRADRVYEEAMSRLSQVAEWSKRGAVELETRLRILHPGWQPKEGEGPVDQWAKEWIKSGFFDETGDGRLECNMEQKPARIHGAALSEAVTHTAARCRVAADGRVVLELSVTAVPKEADDGEARRARANTKPDWSIYTDGGCDDGRAGWAYAVVTGGDGKEDEDAEIATEGYGPVVADAGHPAYIGARRHTNNTAELTAIGEALHALLNEEAQPAETSGVVRTDSEVAAALMTGAATGGPNAKLAAWVHAKWKQLRAKHGGRITWRHVKGHSGHRWNNHVDEQCKKGGMGQVKTTRREWSKALDAMEGPPLLREEGRFTFEIHRRYELVMTRDLVELHESATVIVGSLRWVQAHSYPNVRETKPWTREERRENIEKGLENPQEQSTQLIGSHVHAVVAFSPKLDQKQLAERGMWRFEARMGEGRMVKWWRRDQTRTQQMRWQIEQRMGETIYEIGERWGTAPWPPPRPPASRHPDTSKRGDKRGDGDEEAQQPNAEEDEQQEDGHETAEEHQEEAIEAGEDDDAAQDEEAEQNDEPMPHHSQQSVQQRAECDKTWAEMEEANEDEQRMAQESGEQRGEQQNVHSQGSSKGHNDGHTHTPMDQQRGSDSPNSSTSHGTKNDGDAARKEEEQQRSAQHMATEAPQLSDADGHDEQQPAATTANHELLRSANDGPTEENAAGVMAQNDAREDEGGEHVQRDEQHQQEARLQQHEEEDDDEQRRGPRATAAKSLHSLHVHSESPQVCSPTKPPEPQKPSPLPTTPSTWSQNHAQKLRLWRLRAQPNQQQYYTGQDGVAKTVEDGVREYRRKRQEMDDAEQRRVWAARQAAAEATRNRGRRSSPSPPPGGAEDDSASEPSPAHPASRALAALTSLAGAARARLAALIPTGLTSGRPRLAWLGQTLGLTPPGLVPDEWKRRRREQGENNGTGVASSPGGVAQCYTAGDGGGTVRSCNPLDHEVEPQLDTD